MCAGNLPFCHRFFIDFHLFGINTYVSKSQRLHPFKLKALMALLTDAFVILPLWNMLKASGVSRVRSHTLCTRQKLANRQIRLKDE